MSLGTVIFAFLHHLALILVFTCLFYEHMALKPNLNTETARLLIKIDLIYGISAAVVLIAGVLRVAYFEKGADYYLHNWAFFLKIGLFLLIGLLSIPPTMLFLRWRKQLQSGAAPSIEIGNIRRCIMLIRAELLLFVLMLPPAVLMAKGYGHFG